MVRDVTHVVRRAELDEVLPLRHSVLRPGRPSTASHYDADAGAVHVGAWESDEIVGCGTVFPQAWDGPPPEPLAWRLRGMAVRPDRHGQGIGRLVLTALVDAAAEAGAPVIWANARSTALPFYLRQGWQIAGEEFVTAATGLPHFPILRNHG